MVNSQSSLSKSSLPHPAALLPEDFGAVQPLVMSRGITTGEHWARQMMMSVAAAGMMAIATVTAAPAWSATLTEWNYSPETGALAFELDTAEKPRYFLIANPMRIVVDLPGSYAAPQDIEAQAGGVFTEIRVANTRAGKTRMVLQLAPGTVLKPGQVELTALGAGRWSLQPLLADGYQPPAPGGTAVPTAISTAAQPVVGVTRSAESIEEAPEFNLPSLEAMAAVDSEFVSMEETLARQQTDGATVGRIAVPQVTVPVGRSQGAVGTVQWGQSQLPPVPEIGAAPAAASAPRPWQSEDPAVLPQLPQPRLGQAPLALNTLADQSLVDPAKVVDGQQLRRLAQSGGVTRPPAAVEPVVDPKLLSLDAKQQAAASLGGQTGLVLQRRRRVAPAQVRPAAPRPEPARQPVAPAPAVSDEETPFLVEFGAPLPGVGL